MRQFRHLLTHEWALLFRNGVVRILLAVFVVVIALTIGLAQLRASHASRDADLLTRANAVVVSGHPADYVANQHGIFAVLPAAPLLPLSVGQSDVYPNHYRITSRLRDGQLSGEQLEHPVTLHSGHLDLTFVILYLYSLGVLGLSYDLLATDRATGTLRLLLVQGATTSALAAGKAAARAVFVFGVPLLAAVITFVVTDARDVGRLTLWVVVSVAYGVFWLGVALMVNASGRSAAVNALTLTAIWLVLAVVTPSAVNLAMRVWLPVPSGVQVDMAMREATRAAVAEGSRTLGRFLEDHPATGTGEEGMKQYYALQAARDNEVALRMRPLLETFEARRAEQARAVTLLQFASPTILAQMLLTDIAGTSGHRARQFAAQAGRFHEEWQSQFTPVVLSGSSPFRPRSVGFEFIEEPLSGVLERTFAPLVSLVLVSVALVWTGLRRFAGYGLTEAS